MSVAEAPPVVVPPRRAVRVLRRVAGAARRQPAGAAAVVVLIALLAIALLAPVVSPYELGRRVGPSYSPPSSAHPLGLDDGGTDMLTSMIWGTRVSLLVGFAAALIGVVVGGTIGLLAAYHGGKVDTMLSRVTDYFLVIPDIALMIVVAAVWGRSLTNVILIIGLLYWAAMARIVGAQTRSVCERTYVRRARAMGCGHVRVLTRYVLPQVAPLLLAMGILQVAGAIFAETAVAFLGLGDPTLTSWGRLIDNAFRGGAITVGAWWAIVPPGIAVALVVLACTLLGRSIEERLNPRLRVGHLSVRTFGRRSLEDDAE